MLNILLLPFYNMYIAIMLYAEYTIASSGIPIFVVERLISWRDLPRLRLVPNLVNCSLFVNIMFYEQ